MYYYKCQIEKKASGAIRNREGVVPAADAFEAMDAIEDMCDDWGATLLSVHVWSVDKDTGELDKVVLMLDEQKAGPPKPRKEKSDSESTEIITPLKYASVWIPPTFKEGGTL